MQIRLRAQKVMGGKMVVQAKSPMEWFASFEASNGVTIVATDGGGWWDECGGELSVGYDPETPRDEPQIISPHDLRGLSIAVREFNRARGSEVRPANLDRKGVFTIK